MDSLHRLMAIEDIKNLKARYLRLLDCKQWEEWGEVFTADAQFRYGEGPHDVVHGRKNIVRFAQDVLGDAVTVHHGHMPEIEVMNPANAAGIWTMHDVLLYPEGHSRASSEGYGHYKETYRQDADGEWRIATVLMTRLLVHAGSTARK
jgi:hypothetical protein